jgi:predicted nucleotidyltransferase
MKSLDEIKEIIDIHKDELRKEYGLKEIGVFGSYVRGAQRADSDLDILDILIEFEKPVGFVKFLRLENRLSELLGVRVEMVTKKALKPFIGKRILQEVIYV